MLLLPQSRIRRNRSWPLLLTLSVAVIVCILAFTGSIGWSGSVYASSQEPVDSGYVIENFEVNIKVTPDNTYQIRQVIEVDFFERSRGIFVNIPLLSTVDLEGADFNRYKARVSNISVNGQEFEAYKEDNQQIIRIGDPDIFLTGKQRYEVGYDYHVSKDHSEQADFLYYNIIGPQWTTAIEQVRFRVEMPADFNAEGINFTTGYYGSEDNQRVEFTVDGRTISGSIPGGLSAYEAVTVYHELPEGYFTEARFPGAWMTPIVIAAAILSLLAVIFLYIRFGKDRPVPETVEFYAPDGMDPAHAGYMADGLTDSKDLISLIMYWADQGYLHIIDQDKKLALKKLASLPDDRPSYQKVMFNGLFSGADYVQIDALKNTFYKTMEKAKLQLRGRYQDSIFDSASLTARAVGFILCLVPLLASLLRAMLSGLFFETILYLIGSAICAGLFLFGLVLLVLNRSKWRIRSPFGRVFVVILLTPLLFIAQLLLAILTATATYDPLGTSYIAGAASLLCVPFLIFMSRRTLDGEKLYARLMGFRNFMMTAEKERIEMLVQENPSYFYNVLPYAYVLGVTDKWAKRFEGLAIQPPNWYYGNTMTTFTALYFANQMNRAAGSMNTVMVSHPTSSGSGGGFGSGGGGFSGGGFGGGGGGRW